MFYLQFISFCPRASREKTRGWQSGSIIEPCESTVRAEKILSRIERHVCKVRFLRFPWRTEKEVNCLATDQSKRAEIVTSSLHGSDRLCNVIFTCFCKFYLFLFPILRECTLVKYHFGICIELASSTIGQRTKRVLGHRAKLGQCAKFG